MHVIVTTDGSQASLAGARQLKWIADSREITDVTVIAVVSPYAAAPFANELGSQRIPDWRSSTSSRRRASPLAAVAAVFEGWGRASTSRSAAAPRPRRSSARPKTSTPT